MTTLPTPQAISDLLRKAGFAEYRDGIGFDVYPTLNPAEVRVTWSGPIQTHDAVFARMEAGLTAAGYCVESVGSSRRSDFKIAVTAREDIR